MDPYAQKIQAFSDSFGGWRFVDARQATASYNHGRLRQETHLLQMLVGEKVNEAYTEWMIPARKLGN